MILERRPRETALKRTSSVIVSRVVVNMEDRRVRSSAMARDMRSDQHIRIGSWSSAGGHYVLRLLRRMVTLAISDTGLSEV